MTSSPGLPPPAPTAARPPRNGLGRVALVLGIVAFVAAFIPFVSYVAGVIAIVAIILGIVALTKAGLAKGGAVTGLVLGVLALILGIVMSIIYSTLFFLAAASQSIQDASESPSISVPSASAEPSDAASSGTGTSASKRTVTYVVRGTGKAGTVTYFTINGGESGQEQASDVKLPWKKSVAIKDDGVFESSVFSLTAQNGGGGKISCEIRADGKVISKHSSTGQYAVVSCSGSSK